MHGMAHLTARALRPTSHWRKGVAQNRAILEAQHQLDHGSKLASSYTDEKDM